MHLSTGFNILALNHAVVRRRLRLWCLVVDVAESWQYATVCCGGAFNKMYSVGNRHLLMS